MSISCFQYYCSVAHELPSPQALGFFIHSQPHFLDAVERGRLPDLLREAEEADADDDVPLDRLLDRLRLILARAFSRPRSSAAAPT